jgi:hypothetical protein
VVKALTPIQIIEFFSKIQNDAALGLPADGPWRALKRYYQDHQSIGTQLADTQWLIIQIRKKCMANRKTDHLRALLVVALLLLLIVLSQQLSSGPPLHAPAPVAKPSASHEPGSLNLIVRP